MRSKARANKSGTVLLSMWQEGVWFTSIIRGAGLIWFKIGKGVKENVVACDILDIFQEAGSQVPP